MEQAQQAILAINCLKAAGTVAGIHTAHDGSLSAPSGINAKSLQQDLRSKSMVYAKPRM